MSRIVPFVSVAAFAFAVFNGQTASAQIYTFTKIADSTTDDFNPDSTGAPALSDAGHVAFKAQSSDQASSRVLRSGPALARPLTTIADDSINLEIASFSDSLSVNNTGQVAVWISVNGPVFERIVRGDGGPLTTIAEASRNELFNFMSVVVSINDSGTVAWQGELNQPNFPQGLFTGDGGQPNIIFSTASSSFTSSFAGPMINNAGQIAFRAALAPSGNDAIFRYDGNSSYTPIADSNGPLSAAFDDEPGINSAGRVILLGRSDDISTEILLVGDGTELQTIVDTSGELEGFGSAAINDSNQIAYIALLDDFQTQGIFTGPDLVKDKVIKTGDNLDGSVVTRLSMSREALNNAGRIAFFAQLEDGRGVVMVASPQQTCAADFNGDGTVGSQDFFDFLAAFFAEDPRADFNGDAVINSQDFFAFLGAFFTGC